MVNNSEQIKSMLSFGTDDFYFVEIIKRRKDNPELDRSEKVIRNFYIESFEQYDKLLPIITKVCDYENARAYFRINRRNYKKLALHINKRIAEYLINGSEKSIRTVFDSVAGEIHSDDDTKWIVDIDNLSFDDKFSSVMGLGTRPMYYSYLEKLQIEANRVPLMHVLPTKSGIHIVTRPFNLQKFKEVHPEIDVHKDNMVVLYCP